jgi:redox-sensitive bicupin YhaK (pirin superfamily)
VFHDKAFTAEVSPWLMFDYAAPKEFGPTTTRRGVGQHPHRGFETVTIAFQGEVRRPVGIASKRFLASATSS